METLLLRVRKANNVKLTDDEFVKECMDKLMKDWPAITGYQFERSPDDDYLNVLMWGDLR